MLGIEKYPGVKLGKSNSPGLVDRTVRMKAEMVDGFYFKYFIRADR